MRFDRFGLTAFGHFNGAELLFPAPSSPQGSDLHLVVGQNEAGKSTLRQALLYFLFGFPNQTPFDFRFDYGQLGLSATLSVADPATPCVSLTRHKRGARLRQAETGATVPETILSRWLGGLDRDQFAQSQCLDHPDLVQGGRSLSDGKADLPRQLFAAAGGMQSAAAVVADLEKGLKETYARRSNSKNHYQEARQDYEAACATLKAAQLAPEAWKAQIETVARAQAKHDQALSCLQTVRHQVERLGTLRQALEILGPLTAVENDLRRDWLSPGQSLDTLHPPLPTTAGDQVDQARQDLATLKGQADLHRRHRDEALQARDALVLDPAALEQASAITGFVKAVHGLEEAPQTLATLAARIEAEAVAARHAAKDLGWPADDLDGLRKKVPGKLLRQALGTRATEGPGVDSAATQAREALDQETQALERAEADLHALGAPVEVTPLQTLLNAAKSLLPLEQQAEGRTKALQTANAALTDALAALAPWEGDHTALASVAPPSPESLRQAQERDQQTRDSLRDARKAAQQATEAWAQANAQFHALRHSLSLVTPEHLAEVRAQRDALWQTLRTQSSPPTEPQAESFEAAITQTDALADRRTDQSLSAARDLMHAEALERAEAAKTLADTAFQSAEAEWQAAQDAWATVLEGLGLPSDWGPPAVERWLGRWREAVSAQRAQASAQQDLDQFHQRCRALLPPEEGGQSLDVTVDSLCQRLEAAQAAVDAEKEASNRRDLAQKHRNTVAQRVKSLSSIHERKQAAVEAWTTNWWETLQQCGLPAALEPALAQSALDHFAALDQALTTLKRLETEERAPLEARLQAVAAEAQTLAEALDLSVPGALAPTTSLSSTSLSSTSLPNPPVDVATLQSLAHQAETRLRTAIAQDNDHQRLTQKAQAEADALETTEDRQRQILDALIPLLTDARLPPDPDPNDPAALTPLKEAVARSEQCRLLLDRRQTLLSQFSALQGPGEDLRADLAEADPASLADDEERLRQRLQTDLEPAYLEARDQLTTAKEAVRQAQSHAEADGLGQSALLADQERQRALEAMAEAVREHLRLTVQHTVLRRAMDRYSESNRSPLLTEAERLFVRLTCGRYSALRADLEATPPALRLYPTDAERPVDIDGLSDGTRDQLFLALRLAGVRERLRAGLVLPFIADDLFINFDDQRAAAGLACLADLAEHTQVVMLTHHPHLAEIAQDTLGSRVHIQSMPAAAPL